MPDLTESPQWLTQNASFPGTTECAGLPAVVIHSAADYQAFLANTALMDATALGPVVITWPRMNTSELAVVLQNKTSLGGLIIEGSNEIARLSPALDNLTTVTSGLVLDNLVALTATELINLRFVGAGLRIYRNRRMTHIVAENLETTGGVFLSDLNAVMDASFDALTTVNGTLAIRSCNLLTGTALTNAFPQLRTVQGQLQLYYVSRSGGTARSALSLPSLQTVGSMYIRELSITSFSAPALVRVGGLGLSGTFYWRGLRYLTTLSAPSLATVTGAMTFQILSRLQSLCGLGLERTGYYGTSGVSRVLFCQI